MGLRIVELVINLLFSLSDTTSICSEGQVRLVGGSRSSEGWLEVCSEAQWGTVCEIGWQEGSATKAQVVCRQLGFSAEGE